MGSTLDRWASDPRRKPLVLRGARQVGKSYLIRTWGRERFGHVVELNLEREPHAIECFSTNDPQATVRRIAALRGRPLPVDGSALLFIDEVQAAPAIFAKLRWFAEELPALPLVAAGSLLDLALRGASFSMPVGRIHNLYLEPLGFDEFLRALGEDVLADVLASDVTWQGIAAGTALAPPLLDKCHDLLRQYVLVGGMPEAVARYAETRSLAEVGEIHLDLLKTFRDDFGKYASLAHHGRLAAVLASVPQQLGQKFQWTRVARDERALALREAADLLCAARVCHRVPASPATGVPVAAGADDRHFKLILLDTGLASAALGLSLSRLERAGDVLLSNEGAVAEQVAGQLLRLTFPAHEDPTLYHWVREERTAEAEVDYLLQQGTDVIPVEVKAGASGTLKSLHILMAARRWSRAVRLWGGPPSLTAVEADTRLGTTARFDLLSLPLFLAEQTRRLLDEAPRARPARRRARKR
jgi:hypothetical protein